MKKYVHNQVVKSILDDRYYFAKKMEVIAEGTFLVVGKKVDVTESVQALLKSKRKSRSR